MTSRQKVSLSVVIAVIGLGSSIVVGYIVVKRSENSQNGRRARMHAEDAVEDKHLHEVATYLRSLVVTETGKAQQTRANFPSTFAETKRPVPLLRKPYPTLGEWEQVVGQPVFKDGDYYMWPTRNGKWRETRREDPKDYYVSAAFAEDGTLREFRVKGGLISVSEDCGEIEVIGRTTKDWYCVD